jgi:hypothetical protein
MLISFNLQNCASLNLDLEILLKNPNKYTLVFFQNLYQKGYLQVWTLPCPELNVALIIVTTNSNFMLSIYIAL